MSTTTNNTIYTSSSLINMLPSEPSICVPRIYMNITKERVYDVFADLFGHHAIDRVDMIERTNKEGEPYKRAFVHFKSWPRTQQSTEVRIKLLNGEEVKIVYDQPWYWRISASRLPRPEEQKSRKEMNSMPQRPFIVIEDDDRVAPARHSTHYPQNRRDHPHPRDRGHQQQYSRDRDQRSNNYHDHDRRPQRREYQQHQRHPRQTQRDASFVTPQKPEIAAWVDNKAPGAPKGKKPRLVIKEEDNEETKVRPRRLSFDETSDDITTTTPPTTTNEKTVTTTD